MNQFKLIRANVASAGQNKHVSVPVLLAVALEIASIWLPHWQAQLNATGHVLLAYGIIAASNTPTPAPVDDHP